VLCRFCGYPVVFLSLLLAARAYGQTSLTPAAPPQAPQAVAAHIYDVRSYGAAGDGKALDTEAIAKAIRAAHAAGGGTVVFSPGIYLTGTVELLSNVTLDVEAGAVIEGSGSVGDYGSISEYGLGRTYGVNSSGEGEKVGIIVARNAENVAIVGQGAIDGDGDEFFGSKPHYGMDFDPRYTRQGADFMKSMLATGDGPLEVKPAGRPGTMIIFSHCKNILVRDVTLRNAPNWTLHFLDGERIVVEGIHILNSLLLPNDDGIDCIGCRDAHFSDSDIRAGDDDFAFFNADNVTVTNCSLVSHSSGIRVENTRNSVFSNLSIHANRGLGIYERDGLTANLIFSGIVIETQLLTGHWWGKGEPIFVAIGPPRGNASHGQVRDVRFSNITADAEGGMVLYGDSGSWIHGIALDGIRLKIHAPRKNVSQLAGGNFDFRWTATSLANAVFKHDIPGIYARYVEGFTLRDVSISWGSDLPDYFSSAVECEDFSGLEIDGLAARQAFEASPRPAIVLSRGHGVTIRDSRAEAGTSAFVALNAVSGEGLFAGNDLRLAKRVFAAGQGGFQAFGNDLPRTRK
jgi:hypothetical protein